MEQCEKIQIILEGLKKIRYEGKKIGSATIERDLDISSGYLWKCKECVRFLSENKFQELVEYYKTYVPKNNWDERVVTFEGFVNSVLKIQEVSVLHKILTAHPANKSKHKKVTCIKEECATPSAKKESLASLLGSRGKSNERTYKRTK